MNKELQHHGIKGMRWGVRRYQNKDGSLTDEGRRRASGEQSVNSSSNKSKESAKVKSGKTCKKSMSDEEMAAEVKRMNLQKQYNKLLKEQEKPSSLESTKKVVDSTAVLVNQAKSINQKMLNDSQKKVKMDLSSMSDQQLRERINRANLERQYNDLFGKEAYTVSKGRERVTTALEVGGGVLAAGSSALAIALAVKDLMK